MRNSGLDEAQAGIKITGRKILRYADNTTLIAESKEELKSLLMKVKNHGILSHHFMANRWGNNGKSDRLYFGGLQNHCR